MLNANTSRVRRSRSSDRKMDSNNESTALEEIVNPYMAIARITSSYGKYKSAPKFRKGNIVLLLPPPPKPVPELRRSPRKHHHQPTTTTTSSLRQQFKFAANTATSSVRPNNRRGRAMHSSTTRLQSRTISPTSVPRIRVRTRPPSPIPEFTFPVPQFPELSLPDLDPGYKSRSRPPAMTITSVANYDWDLEVWKYQLKDYHNAQVWNEGEWIEEARLEGTDLDERLASAFVIWEDGDEDKGRKRKVRERRRRNMGYAYRQAIGDDADDDHGFNDGDEWDMDMEETRAATRTTTVAWWDGDEDMGVENDRPLSAAEDAMDAGNERRGRVELDWWDRMFIR